MTVAELKDMINYLDDDTEVIFMDDEGMTHPIRMVELLDDDTILLSEVGK